MKLSWVAVSDPRDRTHRLSTWSGETKRVYVAGLPVGFAANCACSVELPEGATVVDAPGPGVVEFIVFVAVR